MKIISIAQYSCEEAPDGKVVTIFKTQDGWFWLKPLVDTEGFSTPFGSVNEIAVSQNLSNLKLLIEKDVSIEV
ncbi:hypothetical protein C1N32_04455 [Vibrio diazotrophicus]|uniref:Uncharacterized protein n=1 Tax=Vibrio diazotrophicus TaxID=685 RepID=A0A2J8I6Z9_VIBDI|nr:hypothetical protein [Vibrio diazotrophicus]PNI06254.1 hypothetical protein C1N32_04455 [Vibrio diazotrophicus]